MEWNIDWNMHLSSPLGQIRDRQWLPGSPCTFVKRDNIMSLSPYLRWLRVLSWPSPHWCCGADTRHSLLLPYASAWSARTSYSEAQHVTLHPNSSQRFDWMGPALTCWCCSPAKASGPLPPGKPTSASWEARWNGLGPPAHPAPPAGCYAHGHRWAMNTNVTVRLCYLTVM